MSKHGEAPVDTPPPEAEQTVGSDGVTLTADEVVEILYYLRKWRAVRVLVEGRSARNSHVSRIIRGLYLRAGITED